VSKALRNAVSLAIVIWNTGDAQLYRKGGAEDCKEHRGVSTEEGARIWLEGLFGGTGQRGGLLIDGCAELVARSLAGCRHVNWRSCTHCHLGMMNATRLNEREGARRCNGRSIRGHGLKRRSFDRMKSEGQLSELQPAQTSLSSEGFWNEAMRNNVHSVLLRFHCFLTRRFRTFEVLGLQ
jgi:hypothetical protein